MKQDEHRLQVACVNWFGYAYPKLKHLLIAIPNGGKRHLTTAKKLKAEGAKSGVPDLFLAVPLWSYGGLWIEMKVKPNKPSPNQKKYLIELEEHGYAVSVCYSFDEFERIVTDYLDGIYRNETPIEK